MNPQNARQGDKRRDRCATMQVHRRLAAIDPEYRRRCRELEMETRRYIMRYAAQGLRTGVVRIPVVVHVVWNTAAQNISDAQIQSQLDVLNADFRRTNGDAGMVPSVFAAVAADTRIEFALAVRDPACASTTGITRTNTSIAGFTASSGSDERMKSTASGGHDPWDVTRYLNIWVVNYSDGTLGYGTNPSFPAAIQGIVCDYRAFGTVGTAAAPFHLGRTATHEVGHWLNLIHIWGNDSGALAGICSGSDECGDTPNQGLHHFGKPAFPSVSCGNGPNGDMFMNYMDYVDDDAMFMFSQDQATRMNAALSIARTGILSSDGLIPAAGGSPAPDLWMQDNADDTGVEPDASANPMWISDDIWIRNAADGLTNQDHENPRGEELNHVYVRVRNRGCSGSAAQSGTLRLYWAKASTALSWPAPWDGSVSVPALMGGAIGSQAISVAGGTSQIVEFPWTPPDPSSYASFGADQAHFCLLARIETATAPPWGMSTPETGDLCANVQNNNNIVWKNVTVVDTDGAGARIAEVVVGNLQQGRNDMRLVFEVPKRRRASLFTWGQLLVEFRGDALLQWVTQSAKSEGCEKLDNGRLLITKTGAQLAGPALPVGAFGTVHLQFVPYSRRNLGSRVFELDLVDRTGDGRVLGGQRFLLKTTLGQHRPCWDTQLGTFDGVDWMPKGSCGCGSC